jgi:hypothetical protein
MMVILEEAMESYKYVHSTIALCMHILTACSPVLPITCCPHNGGTAHGVVTHVCCAPACAVLLLPLRAVCTMEAARRSSLARVKACSTQHCNAQGPTTAMWVATKQCSLPAGTRLWCPCRATQWRKWRRMCRTSASGCSSTEPRRRSRRPQISSGTAARWLQQAVACSSVALTPATHACGCVVSRVGAVGLRQLRGQAQQCEAGCSILHRE